MEEIREVPHFENGVEHKILITYVIAKVSGNNKDTDAIKTKVHLKRLNIDNYDSQQLQKTTSYLSNVAKLFS